MDKGIIRVHNAETGEIIDREMTPDELAKVDARKAKAEQAEAKQAQADTAKVAAQAKLAALGLTIDDLKALGL